MKTILEKIILRKDLTEQEAYQIVYAIEEDRINAAQLTAIMVGIQMRGIALEEIKGFRNALLELVIPIHLDGSNAIDLCGTGGDGKDTFNISTTTSFVLAAMGYNVIKHGNYGVSSICGSSNVVEALGFRFSADERVLGDQLKRQNLCFLHAPLFHPVLKKAAPIRRDLGIRTFFNSLGPLVNPVQPAFQLSGTYSLELAKIYQHVLKDVRKNYKVVYGMDGYDEVTLTDQTRVFGNKSDEVVNAGLFEREDVQAYKLASGGTIEHSAKIVREILSGKGTEDQMSVVAANTAIALSCFHDQEDVKDLYKEAINFIKSGQTAKTFKL